MEMTDTIGLIIKFMIYALVIGACIAGIHATAEKKKWGGVLLFVWVICLTIASLYLD